MKLSTLLSILLLCSVAMAQKPNAATDLRGVVAITNGGTGADNAPQARINLGISGGESVLTFNAPLVRAINTISLDLSGYVLGTDPRLSDARTPTAHNQAISTVTGLQAALDAKAPLSQPVDVGVAYNGKPGASLVLVRHKFPFAVSIPLNCDKSSLFSEVAAAASAVFSITKNGVQFGTATFALGATTATFSCTATSLTTSDIIKVIAPSSQDGTLADIGGTIAGTR